MTKLGPKAREMMADREREREEGRRGIEMNRVRARERENQIVPLDIRVA